MPIAVIQTGGKQYIVKPGIKLTIEKIQGEPGSEIRFDQVLLTAQDAGEVAIGKPTVSGASVSAKVLSQGLGQKISVIKFKRKVRYKRNMGHRQPQTAVQIQEIKT